MGGGFETALSCDIILASEQGEIRSARSPRSAFLAAASGVTASVALYAGALPRQELECSQAAPSMADEALVDGCGQQRSTARKPAWDGESDGKRPKELCGVSPSAGQATKRVLLNDYVRPVDGMQDSIAYSRRVIATSAKPEDFRKA